MHLTSQNWCMNKFNSTDLLNICLTELMILSRNDFTYIRKINKLFILRTVFYLITIIIY